MRRSISSSLIAILFAAMPAAAQRPPAARPPLVQPAPPRAAIPSRGAQETGPERQWLPAEGRPRPVVRDESFTSKSLGRAMNYRVVLPAGYDASVRRYPVLYLLHGLTGSYVDWETKTHLVEHLRGYGLIVVMPDANDSWYTNSVGTPADRYEDYIVKDLVQEVDGRFRSIATRHARAIAGLSMGGYGALKLGVKFPGTYAFAGGFSSAVGVMRGPAPAGKLTPFQESMLKIFGPVGSETRTANDVMAIVTKAEPARMPYLYVDCGTEDGLLTGNREFVAALRQQKIAYEYRELPGAHTWSYWDQQLPEMLRVLGAHVAIGERF